MNVNVNFLARIASWSDYKNKHCSIVIKGGAILASAYNYGGVHAEARVLKKLWPSKRKGVTLINLRIAKSGEIGNSMACNECLAAMKHAGVAKYYYSTNDGEFKMVRL